MLANFLKEAEPGKSSWTLASEPSKTESDTDSPDEEVSCENCDKIMVQSSILKHIGLHEDSYRDFRCNSIHFSVQMYILEGFFDTH